MLHILVVCVFVYSYSLFRDDEHDRSDDDEDEERIDFTVNLAARERQKMRDDFLAAEHGTFILVVKLVNSVTLIVERKYFCKPRNFAFMETDLCFVNF